MRSIKFSQVVVAYVAVGIWQFSSNASNIYSSLALGLCMNKNFKQSIQSDSQEGNLLLEKLASICGFASICRSKAEGEVSFDSSFLQILDEWLKDGEPSSKGLKASFRYFISLFPENLSKHLFLVDLDKSGHLLPRIYADLDEFENNLVDSHIQHPVYIASYGSQKIDKNGNLYITLKQLVGSARISYKLEMIFVELNSQF